jgi:glycerol-3-phosphate dehydrogenase (NAD(P)+)
VKNVIAIAAGIADGLGYGANTKAALLTRGLAELGRLGTAVGGRPLTFLGLAGNGDLIATCSSPHSRNHRVGRELAAGRSIAKIVEEMHMVAEGVDATPAVLALAGLAGIEMPIATQVADVLAGRRDPAAAVGILMGRPPRPEQDTRTTTVRSSASDRRNPPVSAEEPDAPAYVACVPTTPCAWTAVW